MEMIPFIIGLIVGLYVGFKVSERLHQAVMPDMLRRLGVTPDKLEMVMNELRKEVGQTEEPKEHRIIEIKVEQHGANLYLFRKDNDQFLGQGKTFEEIVQRLEKDFQNVKFHVSKEDGADLLKSS